jgi:hypothetical protein
VGTRRKMPTGGARQLFASTHQNPSYIRRRSGAGRDYKILLSIFRVS